MTPQKTRGPQTGMTLRDRKRSSPPRPRSSAGPLAFLVLAALLVFGIVAVGRPLAEDAFVGYVAEHDTLLRQDVVRAIVAGRVKNEVDLAKDVRAETQKFVITRGDTAGQIGKRLEAEGLVRSALAFDFVLYENGKESALQSGTYTVSAALTPRELARVFEKAPGDQVLLRVIEGWRLTELAAAVEKTFPKITKDAFIAAAVVGDRKNTVLFGLDPKTSLEGFLFPDSYFLRPDASAAQIIDTLLGQFEQRAGVTLRSAAAQRKMTVYDMVKLASIVEREARDRSEGATIAGVYQNRLDLGMKLDADPTIQYAKGTWNELLLSDLKLESPYNTYQVAGLPPTPICSPGQSALEAAAQPAQHSFLYFVAKSDGTGQHAFARTLEEQEANRIKYGNK